MSKKAKGILKFLLTVGIVLSAAAAVFAILTRMQRKLEASAEPADDADDGAVCNGSCADCSICDDEADDGEAVEE